MRSRFCLMGLITAVAYFLITSTAVWAQTAQPLLLNLRLEEALIEAGRVRLRPILMTTLCTILGLLPLALGLGAGAELQKPLAIAVIGGLSLSTVFTLIFVPVIFRVLRKLVTRHAY